MILDVFIDINLFKRIKRKNMKYLKLLKDGFKNHFRSDDKLEDTKDNRGDFLCDYIFNLAVEDTDLSIFYASVIIDVCKALLNRTTFDYIKDEQNYKYYILVLNLPFFKDIIEWGVSIRGAWLTAGIETYKYTSCGLYDDNIQIYELEFNEDEEVCEFIQDIVDFYDGKIIN